METILEVIKNRDNDQLLTFKFTFRDNNMTIVMNFTNNDDSFRLKWKRFAQALNIKENYKIQYCNNGGEVSIEMKDGYTTFKTSKYGVSGDGDIKVTLETNRCKDLLYAAYTSFKK